MKITSIAPWFGGKRTMAKDIIAELGPHTQYFEPFCGALSILLNKEPSQKETVNDLHGGAINLARVIQDKMLAEELYRRLQVVVMSEGALQDARDFLTTKRPPASPWDHSTAEDIFALEHAYWYFLASWMGRNGTAGTARVDYQIAVRWTKNGGSPTTRFHNAVESLPAWHQRLRNVVILQRDGFDIIDRFEDDPTTAIYVDPPYPAETRSGYREGPGSDHEYEHEFDHEGSPLLGAEDDHARLAAALRAYKHARIVVSTYACERYEKLYEGWRFETKTRQKHLHAQNGRGARKQDAPEVLIINGDKHG